MIVSGYPKQGDPISTGNLSILLVPRQVLTNPPAFSSMENHTGLQGSAAINSRKHTGSTGFGSHQKHRRYNLGVLSKGYRGYEVTLPRVRTGELNAQGSVGATRGEPEGPIAVA